VYEHSFKYGTRADRKEWQERAVQGWNPDVAKATSMMMLPMSPHKDDGGKEIAKVMQGLLSDIGFIRTNEPEAEVGFDSGPVLSPADGAMKRLFYVFGDRKTIFNIETMISSLVDLQCSDEHGDNASVMLAAMRRVRCFPGDLHLCMHLLVVVYGHYYGGFMQPFQVLHYTTRVPRISMPYV